MIKRSLSFALIFIAACSSTSPRLHEYSLVLASQEPAFDEQVEKTEALRIRRIELPAFLQTRALAMQVDSNEVVLARQHSWTDRLDDSIARVLERGLATVRPALVILDDEQARCQLDVRFDRFHAAADGQVLASGRFDLSKDEEGLSREFDVSRVLSQGGYANAVTELNRSVGELAREIALAIEAVEGCS